MTPFLQQTAQHIMQKYHDCLDTVCVVLPNRRAKLYLNRYMAEQLNRPVWMPNVVAIEDFVSEFSGMATIDSVGLQFEFYNVYCTVKGAEVEPFDEFITWASTVLQDFNDVDSYLVDQRLLYNYLSEIKALKNWNLGTQPLSDYQKKYIHFFQSFSKYYTALRESLLEKKMAYQGMMYRHVAEHLQELLPTSNWQHVVFCGFNAMNAAEEKIIKILVQQGVAEVLWDADEYYINNPIQEAGLFIRRYLQEWSVKDVKWLNKNLGQQEIRIMGVPQQIGQVKLSAQLLQELSLSGADMEKTVLVLSDENLLMPVLNSMPDEVGQFNITMGLPVKYVSLYSFFSGLFALYENSAKLAVVQSNGENGFYHKDVLSILRHPYVIRLFKHYYNNDLLSPADVLLKATSQAFLQADEVKLAFADLPNQIREFLDVVFVQQMNEPKLVMAIFNSCIDFFKNIYAQIEVKTQQELIELEMLFTFSNLFVRINGLLNQYTFAYSLRTLKQLFSQIVQNVTMPFWGEPLKGMQVMGLLETRTLDFEHVVMLSVNENIIPSGKTQNSFIPFDIRKEFGLPTYKERDAIFAYHLYRLMQRAKTVTLVYNTENDEMGKGEQSRFIAQLKHEFPKAFPEMKITEQIVQSPPLKPMADVHTIDIDKSADVMQRLTKCPEKGFSPTALSRYINCPLQFYFHSVAGLKELDEVEETIDSSTLGTVVHDVLKELYTPHLGVSLDVAIVDLMKPQVPSLLEQKFKQHYGNGSIAYGRNLLIVKVAHKFILNFIREEIIHVQQLAKSNKQLVVKHIEQLLSHHLEVAGVQIKMSGITDRVDETDGTIEIIDYKTGNVNSSSELELKNNDDISLNAKYMKAFQLMMYAWMYARTFPDSAIALQCGIISFRKISSRLMKVKLQDAGEYITAQVLDNFEVQLTKLLSDIFNPAITFSQTTETKNCTYCSFKGVCGR